LYVLKNVLVDVFLRKEGSYSEKLPITSCFDERLMGVIFLCNLRKSLPKFG